ncbi:sporulation protein YqfD [Clostridium tertium]|jgi:similar to stage IV sporulation protein|uniref:sporulation protein YqfD n=1 Tax=Clostridium TaxID=1485 RepID=UPI00019B0311|nr:MULTISPECIES: sporulation protein YqfD [Clostridium]EEH98819.1 sporulation protein YqfD [Clostridium sp. 7_2_43FAA]MBU6136199.1 sporulation protein YqfD [Clostridium tertium]MDB1954373.1 sporulation protein YqfD [Clostridium tertium]MDB1957526.1 sporulation protein YqfD [Clostridium tertium]MDB1961112.1 sporulation protein YqfD [Clostridium tertium]
MATGVFDSGKVVVEVNILKPERLLNILWNENINVINVKRIDVATIRVTIDYNDYNVLIDVVKRLNGKSKVIGSTGILFFIGKLKSKLFLAIGGGIFIALLLYFSTYVWSIEITTKKNVSPYELRQQLYEIGIKPGISKNKIDVKDVEKKLEDVNSDVLWLRARIEGSTLKIFIEEKVNPPEVKEEKQGNLVAKMDGEVSRVYAFSGRSAVHVGDMVKAGDIVIEGINGKEEDPYEVVPEGVVMANTFYEKSMTIKVEGTELKRSGEKDSDIYVEVFGKKIYLKKAIKDFEEYDKIEESGKIIKKANYFEKREIPVTYTKEEAIDSAVNELEESLYNNLTREAKVVDRIISTKDSSDGNIIVNVVFVVEQNIVNNEPIDY